MLFCSVIYILTTATVCLVMRFVGVKSMHVYEKCLHLFKQGYATLVLFNCFNVSFSVGVQLLYGKGNDGWSRLSCGVGVGILCVMLVSVIVMEFTKNSSYG